jgi:hypothetical protein
MWQKHFGSVFLTRDKRAKKSAQAGTAPVDMTTVENNFLSALFQICSICF